jgi:hypothetical protein
MLMKTKQNYYISCRWLLIFSNYASVEVGVKGTRRLRFMSNSITLQSDSCAFNASGTTTLTEKDVTVADLSVWKVFAFKT